MSHFSEWNSLESWEYNRILLKIIKIIWFSWTFITCKIWSRESHVLSYNFIKHLLSFVFCSDPGYVTYVLANFWTDGWTLVDLQTHLSIVNQNPRVCWVCWIQLFAHSSFPPSDLKPPEYEGSPKVSSFYKHRQRLFTLFYLFLIPPDGTI